MPNVVTSFNEEGYKRYGREFVETFKKYWSPKIRLTVFYEGEDFEFSSGVSWRPIEEVEHYTDFMKSLATPIQHGIVGGKYDINYDARMGRKTFIQMHAMQKYGGKVFWIDADSITHSSVPDRFLDECLPDNALSCYLGRDGYYYTESGFIGFNGSHPEAGRFRKNYLGTFLSGVYLTQPPQYVDGKYAGGGWHDCIAYDLTRLVVFQNSDAFVNLAEGLPFGTMHPFINAAPGRYMDHLKGPRKGSRSTEKDLVVNRQEPYWKDNSQKASSKSDAITSSGISSRLVLPTR